MMFVKGDYLKWGNRKGTVIATAQAKSSGYARLLLDDVHLAYWVENDRLDYARRDKVRT